ncbi:MAG TPA: site-specific integrase, partial [Usitatibacteraceae bacterium]|nr:site-specific integrase [Usitatibacteraceae bacterium]
TFTWALNERLTPAGWVNPCRQLRRLPGERERVRYLDDAERARLLDACRVLEPARGARNYRGARYPRLYALVLTALCTGARRGELMALRWRDVDLDEGRARLERSKNGDRRVLILLPQVVEALRPFHSSDGGRFVFGSPQHGYKRPASVDTAWRRAVKRAELADFRFHDLRHCCASYLAQSGAPLNVIAEVLGHRKLDMSRRYAHLTVDTKARAMQAALGGIGA